MPYLHLLTDARREHSANEVYVTGTFDDWRKTVKLDQEDGIFKKTVELPKEHIQYKVRPYPHSSHFLSPIASPAAVARRANFANQLLFYSLS